MPVALISNTLLLGIAGATLLLSLLVLRLWWLSKRVRDELESVKVAMNGFGIDIAGLRLAQGGHDNRVSGLGQQLQTLAERMEGLDHQNRSDQSFHAAISAARRGADVQVLTERYGLTRDAAELLVRLHGFKLGCDV